jgi:hypothetical protein
MANKRFGLDVVLIIAVCGLLSLFLTGCGTSTGWQYCTGVYPIAQINNQQALMPHRDGIKRAAYNEGQ